jgi:hypothetical protein
MATIITTTRKIKVKESRKRVQKFIDNFDYIQVTEWVSCYNEKTSENTLSERVLDISRVYIIEVRE